MAGLEKQSNCPKTVAPVLDTARCDCLQHIVHQSPRLSGKPTGVWTLALAAAGCYEQGVTERLMSEETVRRTRQRLQTPGQRAQHSDSAGLRSHTSCVVER